MIIDYALMHVSPLQGFLKLGHLYLQMLSQRCC